MTARCFLLGQVRAFDEFRNKGRKARQSSASSRCGSADVMEALGLDIQMPVERLRRAIIEVGVGFLFAPRFHSSMKHVGPARTHLKIRTVFNMLGPLANPAPRGTR